MIRLALAVILLASSSLIGGCLVVTPVVKTGAAVTTAAGKVVGTTAGAAVGTTIRTVAGPGDSSDSKDSNSK